MNIINKSQVLKLNSAWQAVGQSTVGKAIVDLAAGKSAMALDFEYEKDEQGNYIFDEDGDPVPIREWARPVDWEEWITLPVRAGIDDAIRYAGGSKSMRAPTVLIAKNYSKMHKKTFKGKPSKEAILLRDNFIDQYTGKKLRRDEATIDHVLPQSRGGPNTWENLLTTSKDNNSRKGNKLNSEIGFRPIRKPEAPRPIPLSYLIREIRHHDWKRYLPHLVDN